jgi:alkylated DNA repair dioxygenase AlkB
MAALESQLALFGHESLSIAPDWQGLRHHALDADSWLEYLPGFVRGHAQLFDELCTRVPFREERRMMYEREVDVPRLVASAPVTIHPLLGAVAERLLARYRASIDHVGLALYRHGQDSVAWHRDKLPRGRCTLVAIVSLGTPRRLLVRALGGGGASRTFTLGFGDLFVMGGHCQDAWEHHVPKVKSAAPRMSIMFRHVF